MGQLSLRIQEKEKNLQKARRVPLTLNLRDKVPEKKQKGIRSSFICGSCEVAFSKDDHYGSLALTDGSPTAPERKNIVVRTTRRGPLKNGKMVDLEEWTGLDLKRMQRFVLGIVLRAHMAGDKLLGPHFDKMKDVYRSDALDPTTYPITACRIQEGNMHMPFLDMRTGHRAISFAAAGFYFLVYVSSHAKPSSVELFRLQPTGSVLMMQLDYFESGVFKSLLPQVGEIQRQHGDRINRWFGDP